MSASGSKISDDKENPAPGHTNEVHPELFATIPPQPEVLKPGQITEEKVKQFFDEGFLAFDSFFEPSELEPCKSDINDMVEELAHKLYNGGKITSLYSEYGFQERLTMIEKEFPGANIILHKMGKQPPAICNLWANERLLNLIEQLIGTSDIAGLPAWNLRPKTPQSQAIVVPWHQDVAYFDNTTYTGFVITAWIPLVNATAETGCLQMIRHAHKKGKVADHYGCWRDTWYVSVEEEELTSSLGVDFDKDVVTCPIPYGGCIIFTTFTPHRGLPNMSNGIRWSFDFRYQSADRPSGFYGLKQGVRLRSSTDPNYVIDWDAFIKVDRRKIQSQALKTIPNDNEFDTTNAGPWMLKWPMTNENRHTKSLGAIDRKYWHNMIVG